MLGLLIWYFDPRATSTTTEAYIYASTVIFLILFAALVAHHSNLGLMEVGMRMRIACSSLMYRKVKQYYLEICIYQVLLFKIPLFSDFAFVKILSKCYYPWTDHKLNVK